MDKYLDYANIFSEKKDFLLLECTNLNKHTIKLEDDKQPPYRLIYSLRPVKLEILKTYIETYLKTGFIRPAKSPVGALILFDKKPNCSFYLCIDYRGLNNLIIENQYLLPLISESVDHLG